MRKEKKKEIKDKNKKNSNLEKYGARYERVMIFVLFPVEERWRKYASFLEREPFRARNVGRCSPSPVGDPTSRLAPRDAWERIVVVNCFLRNAWKFLLAVSFAGRFYNRVRKRLRAAITRA